MFNLENIDKYSSEINNKCSFGNINYLAYKSIFNI